MNPFLVHLIYGTVTSSQGNVVANAQLAVITSITTKIYNTNADGIYMLNLADIGYVAGETITINVTEQFNNELKSHKYTVTGSFSEENITLGLRIAVERISDLQQQNVLHSVGKTPITADNPLSVTLDNSDRIEERRSYNSDNQVEFIGEAKPGNEDSRTGWRIHKRSYVDRRHTKVSWANFNANFDKIWTDRTSYDYR